MDTTRPRVWWLSRFWATRYLSNQLWASVISWAKLWWRVLELPHSWVLRKIWCFRLVEICKSRLRGYPMKFRTLPFILKASIVVVLAACFLCLLYFCFEGFLLDYTNNAKHKAVYLSTRRFLEEIGTASYNLEDIQAAYGSSMSSTRQKSTENPDVELITDRYAAFTVHYTEGLDRDGRKTSFTYFISIEGGDYHFGWLHIGIGSPRFLVRLAFLLDKRIKAEELDQSATSFANVDEGFYGDDWCRILFSYDDAGCVNSFGYEPPFF